MQQQQIELQNANDQKARAYDELNMANENHAN